MTARDGIRLRYALCEPSVAPHAGTVVILTGRNESIEKYFETIRDLNRRGLACAIMDWRGQGGSGRLLRNPDRGFVARFDDYVDDLDQFYRQVVLPDSRGPHFMLAHSTGALIALLAAPILANRVRRMVLIAPFLTATGLPLSLSSVSRLMSLLYWTGFGRIYAYGGARGAERPPFATNRLTTDPRRFARNVDLVMAHRQLGLGGPTVAWVRAAIIASARVRDPAFVERFRIPTLFIAAGADEVVSKRAVQDYARAVKTGSLLTIDGARHEILQEADIYREQVLAAFDAFVPGSDADPLATTGL
ncbi:MAG: alpha/beta hydrolase [Rhizobiaceae bacterium]|nr:alpha/beta hydrolase [Rhizobiaceae bacterium]